MFSCPVRAARRGRRASNIPVGTAEGNSRAAVATRGAPAVSWTLRRSGACSRNACRTCRGVDEHLGDVGSAAGGGKCHARHRTSCLGANTSGASSPRSPHRRDPDVLENLDDLALDRIVIHRNLARRAGARPMARQVCRPALNDSYAACPPPGGKRAVCLAREAIWTPSRSPGSGVTPGPHARPSEDRVVRTPPRRSRRAGRR